MRTRKFQVSLPCLATFALLTAGCGDGAQSSDSSATASPGGSAGTAGASSTGGTGGSGGSVVHDPELDATIQKGLLSWRKPGIHGACAGCHSPDGLDLAAIDFDEATIRRRAQNDEMEKPDEDAIVELIFALRKKYNVTPTSRITFRPFQPNGEVLGPPAPDSELDTVEIREERDRAFLAHLKGLKLKILDGVIDSTAKAEAVADELYAIDLRKLSVGIPFDRWAEDPYDTPQGKPEFKSVAEWVPGLAQRPKPGKEAQWYKLADAYLADPASLEKFWAFYDAIDELTEPDPLSSGADEKGVEWMREKYKSVQIAQHMLFRLKTEEYPDVWFGFEGQAPGAATSPTEASRNKAIARNPIWQVGDLVRINPLHCSGASECMSLPPYVDVPDADDSRSLQTDVIQQSWFWTMWEYDHPLLIAGHGLPSVDGDYFLSTLMNRFAIHHAFLVAKGVVSKARAPAGWLNAKAPDRDKADPYYNASGHGKWASYKPLLLTRQLESNRHVTGDAAREPEHTLMMTNAMRMAFYMMQKELSQPNPTVFDKQGTIKKLTILKGWFHDGQWDDPEYNTGIDALIDDCITKAQGATEMKDPELAQPDAGDIQ